MSKANKSKPAKAIMTPLQLDDLNLGRADPSLQNLAYIHIKRLEWERQQLAEALDQCDSAYETVMSRLR